MVKATNLQTRTTLGFDLIDQSIEEVRPHFQFISLANT